jgi:hypothetical protein
VGHPATIPIIRNGGQTEQAGARFEFLAPCLWGDMYATVPIATPGRSLRLLIPSEWPMTRQESRHRAVRQQPSQGASS